MTKTFWGISALRTSLALSLLTTTTCFSLAQGCENPLRFAKGYTACAPNDWYHSSSIASGAMFLCSDPGGKCTTKVGGLVLPDQATLSIIPVRMGDAAPSGSGVTLLAKSAANEPDAQISSPLETLGQRSTIHYVVIKEPFSVGALNDIPRERYSYFAEVDGHFFRLTLMFCTGDKRARRYEEIAMGVLRSIDSEPPRR